MHIACKHLVVIFGDSLFLGLLSSPQTPSYSVQHYGPHNVTVTVQWGYPESDGGSPVDNYTISGTNLMITTSQVNHTTLTLPYSMSQNIGVTATNCNGTSGTTAFTYFEGGILLRSKQCHKPVRRVSDCVHMAVLLSFPTVQYTGAFFNFLVRRSWLLAAYYIVECLICIMIISLCRLYIILHVIVIISTIAYNWLLSWLWRTHSSKWSVHRELPECSRRVYSNLQLQSGVGSNSTESDQCVYQHDLDTWPSHSRVQGTPPR